MRNDRVAPSKKNVRQKIDANLFCRNEREQTKFSCYLVQETDVVNGYARKIPRLLMISSSASLF